MKTNRWLLGCSFIIILIFCAVIILGHTVDPYFHYHKPLTDKYYYELSNQRSQNDGIVKHFDYDSMLIGTSMTVNFKASEAEELFGGSFIKVPFFGGSYKEINECISTAIKHNPNLKLVIRGLDMGYFTSDKDAMRSDLGEFPTYLYDNNPFNDVKYLLNKDVQFGISYNMISDSRKADAPVGITPFDDYSWSYDDETYGADAVFSSISDSLSDATGEISKLTEKEQKTIRANITQNVSSLAEEHPDITFIYFFPPYSMAYWMTLKENGNLEKQLDAERIVIEQLLQCNNIKLFSFNTHTEITANLDNYFESTHYGSWINSQILQLIAKKDGLITATNYEEYLAQERELLTTYNYSELFTQD